MTEQTPGAGKVIWNWWADHLHADSGAARGLAARLRRADRPAEVLAEPWVFDLSRLLALRDPATLCALASVLAQVREHIPRRLARLLGTCPATSEKTASSVPTALPTTRKARS